MTTTEEIKRKIEEMLIRANWIQRRAKGLGSLLTEFKADVTPILDSYDCWWTAPVQEQTQVEELTWKDIVADTDDQETVEDWGEDRWKQSLDSAVDELMEEDDRTLPPDWTQGAVPVFDEEQAEQEAEEQMSEPRQEEYNGVVVRFDPYKVNPERVAQALSEIARFLQGYDD